MIIFVSLGIIASVFQLVILREFNFSIAKNELALIVTNGFWIICCSLGSLINFPKKSLKIPFPALFSAVFSASICLIHLSKSLIGIKYYEVTGIWLVLFLCLALIGPVALLIGIAFRQFSQEYLKNNPAQNVFGKFFASEAAGFFIGAFLFTFYLSNYSNPLIFSLIPLVLLPYHEKIHKKILWAAVISLISIVFIVSYNFILDREFDNSKILFNLGSDYGPIIATQKSGSTMLFSSGSLLATSEDKSANEEFIHMSLSGLVPGSKADILFIGAAFGQTEEILKHNPASLDCLQINPVITKLMRKNSLANVNLITDDPRLYLKNLNKKYDAILMNMPPPANLALNRYYTKEFFTLVKAALKDEGIFSFNIASKREILSPQFAKFNSSIINAVNQVFKENFIIPSDSMIIIASDKTVISDSYLLENFKKAKIKTDFFTVYHFKDFLNPLMSKYAQGRLDKKISPNTDMFASGFLNYLILEQAKFYPNLKIDFNKIPRLVILLFFLIIAAVIFAKKSYSCRIFSLLNIEVNGLSSICMVSITFVLFQLYCGSLFWKLGILTALFMAGLCIATLIVNNLTLRAKLLPLIYFLWMIVIFILFINLGELARIKNVEYIFYLYTLACGLITGTGYPVFAKDLLKNKFETKNITAAIYSSDLIGAFLGTLICGIILIPFFGIPYSLFAILMLNAVFVLKNLAS